jgi:hypothetical protein
MQHLFARNDEGRRAVNGGSDLLDFDEHWKDHLWFHEFFDGDTGRGLGTSHQCGWTGLIAKIIHDTGVSCRLPQTPRSPFAAASHYFDDIFSRSGRPRGSGRPSVRRSSTTRSIGNRSDFYSGDATPDASTVLDDEEASASRGVSRGGSHASSRRGSTADARDEEHVNHYVASQLQRVRSSASIAAYEDEFETKVDKENGNGQNGHK